MSENVRMIGLAYGKKLAYETGRGKILLNPAIVRKKISARLPWHTKTLIAVLLD